MFVFCIQSHLGKPCWQELDDDMTNAAFDDTDASVRHALFDFGAYLKRAIVGFAKCPVGQCMRPIRCLFLSMEDGESPLLDALIFCMHDDTAQYFASRDFASN